MRRQGGAVGRALTMGWGPPSGTNPGDGDIHPQTGTSTSRRKHHPTAPVYDMNQGLLPSSCFGHDIPACSPLLYTRPRSPETRPSKIGLLPSSETPGWPLKGSHLLDILAPGRWVFSHCLLRNEKSLLEAFQALEDNLGVLYILQVRTRRPGEIKWPAERHTVSACWAEI